MCSLLTREAHITSEGNITQVVRITLRISGTHRSKKDALLNSKIKAWSSKPHFIYTEYGRFVRMWNGHFIRRVKEFTVNIYSIVQHSTITVL